MNTPEANKKKGHVGEKHPSWGKKHTLERRLKQSSSLSDSIMSGKFNPHASHKSGKMEHSKFTSPIFFRSSYEKNFLEKCIQDETVRSVKPSPYKILYNSCHHYIPDFLVEKTDNTQVLVEIKPERRTYENANLMKFEAAKAFCDQRGILFEIFTEKNLYR